MKYTFKVHNKHDNSSHYYHQYKYWLDYSYVLTHGVLSKKNAYFIPLHAIRKLKKTDRFYFKENADFHIVSNEDI